MYDVLKKGRMFNLSVSCIYDLFIKICSTNIIVWMWNMGIHKLTNDWTSTFKIL